MDDGYVVNLLFVINIFGAFFDVTQGHNQAFIQIDNELRYLVDGVAVHMYESISADGTPSRSPSDLEKQPSIRFEPPMLDFKTHAVGMPHAERVTIYNPSAEHTISMLSISGSTVHFHCTFFQEKMIPPLGNTSLDVVFLGREVGPVESFLYIHSSVGSFRFQVQAEGTPNPYRLKPLVGVKMPLNSSYSPLIEMYNPHKTPLQVLEMYSSGGDLHLELPHGGVEGRRAQWQVPPYHSRPVMRASFVARQENNHTAFIRIKTNSTGPAEDYLVLPVEVEVTSEPGLFCPLQPIQFGLVAAGSQPRVLWLPLINAANKPIHLQHVVASPANEAIEIEFEPVKLVPTTGRAATVAKLTFYPDRVKSDKQLSGKIFIKSKSNQHKIQVPYTAELVGGALEYDASQLQFRVSAEAEAEPRSVVVTNQMAVSLAVYNVTLSQAAQPHFTLRWRGPLVLARNGSAELATLELRQLRPELQLRAHLVLHTNVTELRLPVSCYSGKLSTYIPPTEEGGPSPDVLDFGTLGVGEKRDMFYYLLNENPVPVQLQGWGSNLSGSVVELVGTERGDPAETRSQEGEPLQSKQLLLQPGHYAVIRVGIVSTAREGLFAATSFVHTEHEQRSVPFRLRVASGGLASHPSTVTFEKAFPGKTSAEPLSIHSTFGHAMSVSSVRADPADSRLTHERPPGGAPLVLRPHTNTSLGRLLFRPAAACGDDCYTGFQLSSKRGAKWLQGLALPTTVGDLDSALFHAQHTKYLVAAGGGRWHNLSLRLDTTEVRGHRLRARAQLVWPQLLNRRRLRFGVTQVGNVSVRELSVENPSDQPLAVHLTLLSDYPATQATMDIIRQLLGESPAGGQRAARSAVPASFTLLEAGRTAWWPDQPLHRDTMAALVPPLDRLLVPLVFLPNQEAAASDVLIIRNNLTVMDMLVVQGRGAHGQLKFGNQRPGSSSPLLFELAEKHLKDCSRRPAKYLIPNFTVKRAFTTRNVGDVPISIFNFSIDGLPCEGFGFRVLNCAPFQLEPNSSRKVEVAFTPDFTLSVVRRSLRLHTSLPGVLVYPMLATLPPPLLPHCQRAVPRPEWEPLVYCVVVTFMIFMLFSVLAAAFFESDRILKDTFDLRPPSAVLRSYQQRPRLLDLRRIGEMSTAPAPLPANGTAEQASRKPPETKPEPAPKPVTPPAGPRASKREEPVTRSRVRPEKATAEESEAVMRRRRALKEAKNQRGWASSLMQSLGMQAPPFTVTEDVRPNGVRPSPRASDGGSRRAENNDDADSVTSSTDISTVDEDSSVKTDRDRGNTSNGTGQCNMKTTDKTDQARPAVEPSSKAKPVKKSKAKSSSSLPNMGSLELPYKPKTSDEKKDKKKPRSKVTVAAAGGTRSPSWSPVLQPPAAVAPVVAASAPLWDAPAPVSGGEDALDLLAQQTENFARGLPARSSFASVVSGQGDGARKVRRPAVGRVAPERHQPAAALGPIAPPHRQPTPPAAEPPLWPPAAELPAALQAPVKPTLETFEEPSSFGLHSLLSWSTAVPPPTPAQQPSLMQSLQAERRAKVQQYEQERRQRAPADPINDWPGFGGGVGGLWDAPLWGSSDAAWSPASADPWAPRAAADSGWPSSFPAGDEQ